MHWVSNLAQLSDYIDAVGSLGATGVALFIGGLLAGYFVARLIKLLLLFGVILGIAVYLGLITVDKEEVITKIASIYNNLKEKYGDTVAQAISVLGTSTPFLAGVAIGFLVGIIKR